MCGVDLNTDGQKIPVYCAFAYVKEKVDVIIDFSSFITGLLSPKAELALSASISAVPDGASTFWLWCRSIISISKLTPSVAAVLFTNLTFAVGAIRAAKWLAGKPAGKYDMNDVLENL